jgi:hypothetical protein
VETCTGGDDDDIGSTVSIRAGSKGDAPEGPEDAVSILKSGCVKHGCGESISGGIKF